MRFPSSGLFAMFAGLGDNIMHSGIVLGDRLLVQTRGPKNSRGGYAWIHPATGQAKIAWPIETTPSFYLEGIAVRDVRTFALVMHSGNDTPGGFMDRLSVGIAGPDGWLRAPTPIADWKDPPRGELGGRPLLLGASWVAGELEIVLTHPGGEDSYGTRSPVDIVRVATSGPPIVRSQALGCDCEVEGALPGATGWTLIVKERAQGDAGRVSLVDPAGAIRAAPAMAGFDEHNSDRSALGTLWARSPYGANRVELDGTLTQPAPAVPGWKALLIAARVEWVDGVVRSSRVWTPSQAEIGLLAHRVGDRTIFAASPDEGRQLVGTSPETLRPTISASSSSAFRVGVFLPRAGGGYHWVEGRGDYVTLDAELRRVDPQSLRHHLRTRGSVGDYIDEPRPVWFLGWTLFGLPLLVLAGLAFALVTRARSKLDAPRLSWRAALISACVVYVLTGGLMLVRVLPLL